MADSVVTFLLQNLTQLLTQESNLQGGVKDQVRSLKNELSLINLFLQKTEGKRQDELVKELVSQIRDVAYEAEDVIDTYVITVTEHRRRSKLRKLIHSYDRASTLHEVASKIDSIKIINKEINDNRSKYGIEIAESSGGDAEAEEILHRRRKHVEEDHVVGFAHDAEVLVKELMEGSLQRNVVSIVGMGGLGKTTLARKIYNNNDVKNYFNFRGWVYVSQEYRIKELLLEILKGLSPLPRVMLRAELKEKLLRGLYATYSSNNDNLKERMTEDLKRFKEMNDRSNEMNDEEFGKAWSEFLKGVDYHNDLKNSLSNFVQDFYSENGVNLRAELKEKLLHGLYATYSSKNEKLKQRLTDDLKRFKEMNERFKEMNDEEFRKAWSEFLEGVQDHNDLKNSLSNFVQDFYSENGVNLRAELKEKLLHGLYATYSSKNDKLKGTLTEDLKRFKEMNERFKEMNDEEFRKALSEFLEGVQDHNDLKNSLSNFVQDFYSEDGVNLRAELKEKLLDGLYAMYSSKNDKLKGTLPEDLKRFKEMNERFKEMNDEEFKKAWSEFLEGVQNRNDLKNSLSNFVQDFYSENRVKLKDMTEEELRSVLLESLKDKRYLLVMDDIWNIEVWNEVSTAFPNNSNRSRILITTRIKEVSLHASSVNNSVPPIPPYELPLLEEDKSWELFSKKVFWEGTCPLELETLGRQLVNSCHGLPLAIVVLGGLLASKEKTHRIWSKYIGHVNSYLTDNRSSCRDILALSYNHLPRRLKPCFLYFGIYPEDFEIPVRQLIRLWIAEGFIWQIGNRYVEDVAEDYLEELIDRSLIQVATKRLDGGVKTCRIHDLLRDLCISESSEEKFLEVHSNVNLSLIGKSRRISIHNGNNPYISSNPCESSNSRSIIGFGGVVELESPPDNFYLEWICKSNKLVRVLELSNMGICCVIPKGIEKLVLLRYLSIASGEPHVIPDSIRNLWNLETLDMRKYIVETKCLPKGIWKLQRLRHLYLDGPTSLPKTENTVALPNLQVLTGIAKNEDTESHFAKARFPNLRKLGLYSSIRVESGILSSLHPLCHLQTLKLYNLDCLTIPTSSWLTLTKITIVGADISLPTMRVLGSLTKLRILKLRGFANLLITNDFLNCDESSFQQLEVFKMVCLNVFAWNMGQGAMPNLQRLVIESCVLFCMLPNELWCLSALRDVEVSHPGPELVEWLQKLQMRGGCKLHVYPPLNPTN